jgi:hypothetical protein
MKFENVKTVVRKGSVGEESGAVRPWFDHKNKSELLHDYLPFIVAMITPTTVRDILQELHNQFERE